MLRERNRRREGWGKKEEQERVSEWDPQADGDVHGVGVGGVQGDKERKDEQRDGDRQVIAKPTCRCWKKNTRRVKREERLVTDTGFSRFREEWSQRPER